MSKFVATITPPTPNGDLHIGHIAGPFLAADVFSRAQKQRGYECLLVSYSDDYQSYMLRKGMETGIDHKELSISNTQKINDSLKAVNIDIDNWMSSQDNPFFYDAVKDMFESAKAKGSLYWKVEDAPYCPDCDVWGYEAFGRGLCNFCNTDSDASQCEECGQTPDPAKMSDFVCKLCSKPHVWEPTGRWFLKMGEFKSFLRKLHSAHPMRIQLREWIERSVDNLEDWPVTRPHDGGLDLAEDGSCRVHTWAMGLTGYIAAVHEFASNAGDPALANHYLADPDACFMHFLGHDCAYSHALVYPVQLSMMPQYPIQQRFVSNMFLKLDGLNLSTSRGHAIWISDFAKRAPSDSIRLYLAHVAPEGEGSDFWSEAFDTWLEEVFEELIPAILNAGAGQHHGSVSAVPQNVERQLDELCVRLSTASDPACFSMKEMADVVLDALKLASSSLGDLAALKKIALFIAAAGQPLVPLLSEQIRVAYKFDDTAMKNAIRVREIA